MIPGIHRNRKQSSPKKLILWLLALHLSAASAQERYVVEYLGWAEGLPSLNIVNTTQDFQGLMWFAAYSTGVIRYDGTQFMVLSSLPESNPRISSNLVSDMCRDKAGNLWLATDKGIDILDPKLLKVTRHIHIPECADSANIPANAVYHDKNDDIWAAVPDIGIVLYPGGVPAEARVISRLHLVKYLNRSPDGVMWAVTDDKVFCWKNGDFVQQITPEMNIPSSIVRPVENETGQFLGFRLVLISDGTVPFRLNLQTDIFEPGVPENAVIATSATEISRRILATASPRSRSPLFNHALRTFRDTSGIIWVSPEYAGVFKLKKAEMEFKTCPDLSGVSLRGMIEKPDGSIYIASYNGLFHYFPLTNKADWMFKTRFDIFYHLALLRGDTLTVTSESNSIGNFLMRRKGIFMPWPLGLKDGLDNYTTLSLGKGWLLAGNHNILRVRPSDWKTEPVANLPARPSARTFCFTKTRNGNVWIGTTEGVFILKPDGSFEPTSLRNDHRLGEGSRVNDIYEDIYGRMWFATFTYGLLCYDPGIQETYAFDKNSGFVSNEVYKIMDSHHGNVLWVSTFSGLQCIQLNNNRVTLFTQADGISGNEFNTGSFLRASGGEIYYGGVRGLTHFNPADFHPDLHSALPFISGINIEDIYSSHITHLNYPARDTLIELTSGQNTLEFFFGCTNYFRKETKSYLVQLEGLDSKWVPLGTTSNIKFYHLPSGTYTFRVKVVESGFSPPSTDESVYSVSIRIDQVYYRKWWFIALAVGFFLIFIGYLIYLRLQRIKREEDLRKRIAADLHDDLGGNLSGISNLVHTVKRLKSRNEPLDEALNSLLELTQSAHSTISDIIWALDQWDNNNQRLKNRMEDYSDKWLKSAGIKVNFSSNQQENQKIPFSMKHQLLLAYKEILGNILKHTFSDAVDITLNILHKKDIDLIVINHFRERKSGVVSSGRGLSILRERMARIKGTVETLEEPHSFQVHIRIRNAL